MIDVLQKLHEIIVNGDVTGAKIKRIELNSDTMEVFKKEAERIAVSDRSGIDDFNNQRVFFFGVPVVESIGNINPIIIIREQDEEQK